MSDGIKITTKVNLGGIAEKLAQLEPKVSRNLLRRALRAVGAMWIDAIRNKVPIGDPAKAHQKNYVPGDLRESIIARVKTRKGKRQSPSLPSGSVEVGPGYIGDREDTSTDPGIYGKWVEFGLDIKNYPKQPFMRPVFDSTTQKAIDLFADTMREGLDEALKD